MTVALRNNNQLLQLEIKKEEKKKKEKEVQSSTFSTLVMIAKREMILLPVAPFRH